ncbi:MAG: glycogen synthase [Gemmatimonadota bacterium]
MSTVANPQRPTHLPAPRAAEDLAVVHLVAEYWPYARTGGLAEAVRGIATFQAAHGTPVTVFMPLYRSVRDAYPDLEPARDPFYVQVGSRLEEARVYRRPGPRQNPRVLFIANDDYFGRPGIYGGERGDYPDNPRRFAFYNLAALQLLPELLHVPVVLHAHDWHTAVGAIYLRTKFAGRPDYDRIATVLSVHNAGFQGHFDPGVLADIGLPPELFHWRWLEWYGRVNLLKGGLVFSDYVTTVSPTHALELRTPAGGFGLHHSFIALQDRFVGIRNGIDLDVWDPENDPEIAAPYSRFDPTGKARCKQQLQRLCGLPEYPRTPLFGMTARLVGQKGIDLMLDDGLLHRSEAQIVFLGEGEERYETALGEIEAAVPDRVVLDTGFSERKEHQLLAGADLLLMPSLYEPCGLTQMRAQRYGALPVARRVGGLADTIEDQVTGFLFDEYSPDGLWLAMTRAMTLYRSEPDAWEEHMVKAMGRDFGWASSAQRYLDVYRRALAARSPAEAG